MQIGDWAATRDLNRIYGDIRDLGLEANLAELEAFGFTVIEGALSPDLTKRLRGAVLEAWEERYGRQLDLENETELKEVELASYLLFKDPVFEEAVLNEKPLALITYLLGQSCWLSSLTSHVKGPGKVGLLLHSDTANGVPAPFSAYSHVANCNYALTDYTEAGRAWPWCRAATACTASRPAGRCSCPATSAIRTPSRSRSRPAARWSGTATPGTARSRAPSPACG